MSTRKSRRREAMIHCASHTSCLNFRRGTLLIRLAVTNIHSAHKKVHVNITRGIITQPVIFLGGRLSHPDKEQGLAECCCKVRRICVDSMRAAGRSDSSVLADSVVCCSSPQGAKKKPKESAVPQMILTLRVGRAASAEGRNFVLTKDKRLRRRPFIEVDKDAPHHRFLTPRLCLSTPTRRDHHQHPSHSLFQLPLVLLLDRHCAWHHPLSRVTFPSAIRRTYPSLSLAAPRTRFLGRHQPQPTRYYRRHAQSRSA